MADLSKFPAWFDSSAIKEFRSCEMRDFYGKKEGLISAAPNIHFISGGAFAKGLEVARRQFYLQGKSSEDSIACGLEALWQYYGKPDIPDELNPKPWDLMSTALVGYFDKYKLGEDFVKPFMVEGALTVEFSFSCPLPINHPTTGLPLLYCGRFDAIGDYRGALFICDEKTSGRFSYTNDKWDMRGQFLGYTWGAEEHGLKIAGTIVREVAVRSSGDVDFKEDMIFHAPWEIKRWERETVRTIQRMIEVWRTDSWSYDFGDSCERCSYHRLCKSEDWKTFVNPYYKKSTWNPLSLPEPLERR